MRLARALVAISPVRRPRAGCAPRRSTSFSATMHEVRIVEVEIMSMLISSSASVSNIVAAMPGCVFMPTPTRDTRATSESAVTPEAPSSSACAWAVSTATGKSVVGTVKEMSVVPRTEVFCTIMSTLIDLSARARKSRAATPGRSGTPLTVTLASEVSWVTAVTTASSMSASSSTTQVPGSQVKLLRTCSGTLWLRANSTARGTSGHGRRSPPSRASRRTRSG